MSRPELKFFINTIILEHLVEKSQCSCLFLALSFLTWEFKLEWPGEQNIKC